VVLVFTIDATAEEQKREERIQRKRVGRRKGESKGNPRKTLPTREVEKEGKQRNAKRKRECKKDKQAQAVHINTENQRERAIEGEEPYLVVVERLKREERGQREQREFQGR